MHGLQPSPRPPWPSLGSRGNLDGSPCSPQAAAISGVMDGPRLGGRGDEGGVKRGLASSAGSPDTNRNKLCACGNPPSGRRHVRRQTRPPEAPSPCILNVVPSSRFVPLRSVPPLPGTSKRRDPDSRVSRARGRLSAPARFARLIARARPRARAERRAHFARWPNRGPFRAGANREAGRPRKCRLASRLPIWLFTSECQSHMEKYF